MRGLTWLCLLLNSCIIALALDLDGHIQWNDHCTGLRDLGQAKVALDDGVLQGGITRDGGFSIQNVPPGTYILSVISHHHTFDKLRIDVHDTDSLPEVRPYVVGTPLSPAAQMTLPYPISITAVSKLDFYKQQPSFNVLDMLKNPMMLMMVFGGAMVFAMPYLMKNMDPDMLKDFEERHAKISGIQNSLQSGDIKSSLSQLMATAEEESGHATGNQASEAKSTPSNARHRSGKNKKR